MQVSAVPTAQSPTSLSVDTEYLKGKKMLFRLRERGGFGDIACCLKIATALVERGGLSRNDIIISGEAEEEKIHLFNRLGFEILDTEEASEVHGIALQVILPMANSGPDHGQILGNIPTFGVYEYSYLPDGLRLQPFPNEGVRLFKALGVSSKRDELGIYIDKDLADWGFSAQASDPKERLSHLRQINPELRKAIIGLGSFNAQLADFERTGKLYFGYCAKLDSAIEFVKAVRAMNAGSPKNSWL